MKQLCEKGNCTGCGACAFVCATGAIHLTKDIYGFTYPEIDSSLCINCGRCQRVCHVSEPSYYNNPKLVLACYAKEENIRLESSSGGIGTILAKYFVENGGIVYGCSFQPPMEVKHIKCSTANDICKLRGSKYVQSDITGILQSLKQDLCQNRQVLFIGTPCQAACAKTLFKKHKNLTVVDLVCHGVPSMQFLKDTLPKGVVTAKKDSIRFRENNEFHFSLKNGISTIYERPLRKDIFLKGFFTGLLFRKSCYFCRYARKERIADITIADFWKLRSEIIKDEGKGVSLVLVNTEIGVNLFEKIKHETVYEERTLDEALTGNQQLNEPYSRTARERIFKYLYPKLGYKASIILSIPGRILGTTIKNIIRR